MCGASSASDTAPAVGSWNDSGGNGFGTPHAGSPDVPRRGGGGGDTTAAQQEPSAPRRRPVVTLKGAAPAIPPRFRSSPARRGRSQFRPRAQHPLQPPANQPPTYSPPFTPAQPGQAWRKQFRPRALASATAPATTPATPGTPLVPAPSSPVRRGGSTTGRGRRLPCPTADISDATTPHRHPDPARPDVDEAVPAEGATGSPRAGPGPAPGTPGPGRAPVATDPAR